MLEKGFVLLDWMKTIVEIVKGRFEVGLHTNVFLEGPPGTGKTMLGYVLGEIFEAKVFEFRCTNSMKPEELLYVPAIKDGNQVVYIDTPFMEAFKASVKERVVIIIDEIDKARDRLENLMLRALETFEVRDALGNKVKAKPENVIIVATSNATRDLMEATLRRFTIRYKVDFPKKEVEKEIVKTIVKNRGVKVPGDAIDIILNVVRELRKVDANKAASYAEMADMLVNMKILTKIEPNPEVVKNMVEKVLWKGEKFPEINTKRIAHSLLQLLRE